MSKKDKILEMFNSIEWQKTAQGYSKIFTNESFRSRGLCGTVEYGEKYCDVIYARRIFQKMGFKVGIGMAFYITKPL